MPDDNFFTGAGATGQPVDAASSGILRTIYEKLRQGKNANLNPGTIYGYSGLIPSGSAARVAQADTVFGQPIRRSVSMELRLRRVPAARWRSPAIRTEIL